MSYPTIKEVKEADIETLADWYQALPNPQTDVEITVRKRLENILFREPAKVVREEAPDIADKWNKLEEKISNLGFGSIGKM